MIRATFLWNFSHCSSLLMDLYYLAIHILVSDYFLILRDSGYLSYIMSWNHYYYYYYYSGSPTDSFDHMYIYILDHSFVGLKYYVLRLSYVLYGLLIISANLLIPIDFLCSYLPRGSIYWKPYTLQHYIQSFNKNLYILS